MFSKNIDEMMREGETRLGQEEDEQNGGEEGSSVKEQDEADDEENDGEDNFLEVDPEVEEIMEELTSL